MLQPCYPLPCRLTDVRLFVFVREHGSLNSKAQARLAHSKRVPRTVTNIDKKLSMCVP